MTMNKVPFFYFFTSDEGTYYGTNAFIGMRHFKDYGDATYKVLQAEIHRYIQNGHAVEMWLEDDPSGNFPWLYFNFTKPDAEAAFLATYSNWLEHFDIRSVKS